MKKKWEENSKQTKVIPMLDYKIGWRQSHSVRNNITKLLKEIMNEMNEINRLQFEIIQKQLLDNKVTKSEDTTLSNIAIGLNGGLSFEDVDILKNMSEIRDKQETIQRKINMISINLTDDSDLIFMGLVDAGEEITSQYNDIDMQICYLRDGVINR